MRLHFVDLSDLIKIIHYQPLKPPMISGEEEKRNTQI